MSSANGLCCTVYRATMSHMTQHHSACKLGFCTYCHFQPVPESGVDVWNSVLMGAVKLGQVIPYHQLHFFIFGNYILQTPSGGKRLEGRSWIWATDLQAIDWRQNEVCKFLQWTNRTKFAITPNWFLDFFGQHWPCDVLIIYCLYWKCNFVLDYYPHVGP